MKNAVKQLNNVRQKLFYCDVNAEKMFAKIDKINTEILDAVTDPTHPLNKMYSPSLMSGLYKQVVEHYSFRAQLDWAKEQYYTQGDGFSVSPNVGPIDIYA